MFLRAYIGRKLGILSSISGEIKGQRSICVESSEFSTPRLFILGESFIRWLAPRSAPPSSRAYTGAEARNFSESRSPYGGELGIFISPRAMILREIYIWWLAPHFSPGLKATRYSHVSSSYQNVCRPPAAGERGRLRNSDFGQRVPGWQKCFRVPRTFPRTWRHQGGMGVGEASQLRVSV